MDAEPQKEQQKIAEDPESTTVANENPYTEGTFYQNQLDPKAKRKHFFSPLDKSYADAVHNDAETVVYTDKEEYRVKRKIDNTVLPLVVVSYFFNQFDRNNIGNAHTLDEFNENFGITDNDRWTLVLSIFFVGYCLLEIPGNILQRYVGANRFFFISLTIWGLASLSFVYSKGYSAILALRVLIGIGEAGYHAGMIYYLSFWYKRHELAMRIALCMTGTFPGAIGGLIAFGLIRLHTPVLDGWQFLLLIEAVPTLIIAIAILLFLPSFPFSAFFLTPRERAIAQARLNRDHKPTSHGSLNGWQAFKAVVKDVHSWMLAIIYTCMYIAVATMTYFLPTLIKDMGFSAINAQGLTVAPYVVGWFMVVFQAAHSDRTRDRGYHIMLSCAISVTGYIILATSVQKSVGAAYFALFLIVGGNFCLFPLVTSWAANTFSPTPKRGVGTAFIVTVSNTVSIASPQIYFDPEDSFRKGHAVTASCLSLAFCIAFALRTQFAYLNRRNKAKLEAMSKEEKDSLPNEAEVPDGDPRYVFMT